MDAGGPFSMLPFHWLVQIFQWLPTQILFQIMSTNREWECGARDVLKRRESLVVNRWFRDRHGNGAYDKLSAAVSSLIKRMESVKRLTVMGDFREADVLQLLTSFAPNLVELDVFCTSLTLSSITFPNLKQLWVNSFDAAAGATFFPRLEYLFTHTIVHGSHGNAVMPLLRDIEFTGCNDEHGNLRAFMSQNARTVTRIAIYKLDVNLHFDVTFGKLEVFHSQGDFAFASKCPALKSLIARNQVSPITVLPVAQMTVLEVDSYMTRSDEEAFLTLAGQMVNLKDLLLKAFYLNDSVLVNMFSKATQLERVVIAVEHVLTTGYFSEWTRAIHLNNKDLKSLVVELPPEAYAKIPQEMSPFRLRPKPTRIKSKYLTW